MRTEQQAAKDMQRILRNGEIVLANCSAKPAEDSFTLGIPETDVSYFYITNARLIWLSGNNDGVLSIPWKYMTAVRQGKKRFKNTLGYSFRRPSFSGDIDYPAEYVSGAVAKAVAEMMTNAGTRYDLPVEFAEAIKVSSPHDDSPIGMLARMHNLPEHRLECSVCGKMAGFCQAEGDTLLDACEGCERAFSGIRRA